MSNQELFNYSNTFDLIWLYWYKKYIYKKNKKAGYSSELTSLKQKYKMQSISIEESRNNKNHTLRKKLEEIRQKACPFLLSTSSSSTTANTSLTSPPHFFIINPELQSKEILSVIALEENQHVLIIDKQQINEMINQFHSYYLNCKCVFVIYKADNKEVARSNQLAISQKSPKKGNSLEGSLLNSKLNLSSLGLNQEDSLGVDRNDSVIESYDKLQNKIENMQIISIFCELDGLQIWNVKYFSIPHCFIKLQKSTWSKSFSQTNSIQHPSQPKTILGLPIVPKLSKYQPSIDKLRPFVSYMQMVWQRSTNLWPVCESIFEYNNLPYIFVQDSKQESIAVLCYYIAFGNQGGCLSENMVNRWIQYNYNSELANTIRYLKETLKGKNKNKQILNSIGIKGLFNHSDDIW